MSCNTLGVGRIGHSIVDLHSVVRGVVRMACSSGITLDIILQLILALVLEIDTSILGHVILATDLASLLGTGHLRVTISSNTTALASLARNTVSLVFDIFIQLFGPVFLLVSLKIGLGLLRGEFGGSRSFGVPSKK